MLLIAKKKAKVVEVTSIQKATKGHTAISLMSDMREAPYNSRQRSTCSARTEFPDHTG